ncbi:MAG: aureobasidin A resistance protein [Nitrospinaceae bacterium]|nr:MAG: aureobasidin A resistance protein [Nitrospinaceae bacterium]
MPEVDQIQDRAIQTNLRTGWTTAALSEQWLGWWHSRSPLQKLLPFALMICFWLLHAALGGFRADHLVVALLALAYYAGPRTQSLYLFFLPFTLYLILYDSQSYYADLIRGEVRVTEPYQFDKTFFGIETSEGRLLPSEWLQKHTHPALDIITSLAYLTFIPVCLTMALYFRFFLGSRKNSSLDKETIKTKTHALMWGMFWLNILCCSTYFWYPAAPPWYVEQYGFGPVQLDAAPSAAGALRFDAYFGISLFADFYAKCPNVFGAIPSGHVAFPLLCVYFAFKLKSLRVFSLAFYLLISFSAVYLNHHYIIDLIWGSAYGLLVGWAMDTYYRSRSAA